jgi:hypothetical protein
VLSFLCKMADAYSDVETVSTDVCFAVFCRIHAPADIAGTSSERPFGLLPHQIRGSLSSYNILTLLGYSSSSCIACSEVVGKHFESHDCFENFANTCIAYSLT